MKKTLLSLAAAAVLGLASASASAEFLDFVVQEGSVVGTPDHLVNADKIGGQYQEYLTATSLTTFSASAIADMKGFFANEGSPFPAVPSYNGSLGATGYGLYAVFVASGNITGPNQFEGTAGQFYLYIDPNQDTTFNDWKAAKDAVNLPVADTGVTNDDDYLIAYTLTGTGTGDLNGPPGAFNIDFTQFTLTAKGKDYFISPNPFHMNVRVNGDYDGFVGSPVGDVATVTGDVSAVFLVPEPTSLALMGLGLIGLGATRRRRNK